MSEMNGKLVNSEIANSEKNNERSFIASFMWLIAIFTLVIGFVVMVGSAGYNGDLIQFAGAVIITVNGVLIMGFAKVIQLLTEIKGKL